MNVFVTGATSGLGLAVVRHLVEAGHKVAGFAESTAGARDVRAAGGLPVYAELGRASELQSVIAMSKAQVIVNLTPQAINDAPFAGVRWSAEQMQDETRALVSAAQAAGVQFMIHASAAFVYGDHSGERVTELSETRTGDHAFMKSLLSAEKAVLRSGIPGAVMRLGFGYGAQSAGLQALARTLLAGRPVATADAVVNWLHHADAAEAIRRVVEARPAGETFNVVDQTPTSTADFVEAFSRAQGLNSPGRALGFLARGLLSPVQQAAMQFSVSVMTQKISRELGWQAQYPSHERGFEQILLSWRAGEGVQ